MKGPEGRKAIQYALDMGYRFFDTASLYETETDLGRALKESGLPREEYFIETKLWIDEMDDPQAALERSLRRMGTDYVDIYMIHWPRETGAFDEDWKARDLKTYYALERLVDVGKIRRLGLSNFLPHHLTNILENCRIKPVVDQLEIHPGYSQDAAVSFCLAHGVLPMAWCPLRHGLMDVQDNGLIQALADKYGKSVQQVILRHHLQRGVMPIPKAVSEKHMRSNMDIFDFTLTEDEVSMLTCMPQTGWLGEHPDCLIPKLKSNFDQK